MKKIVAFLLSILIIPITVADHHPKAESKRSDKMGRHFLLDHQDCKEKWAKAAFFSELAANYSTVYQVWCKRRPKK